MNSPFLDLPVRTESEAKRERFIRNKIAFMRADGFSPATLAREEALLRGGAEVVELINHIYAKPGALK